jgi:cytoskeleton protein RodZ
MFVTLGSSLRKARLAAGFSIPQVSQATRIRPNVLEDLENDNFSTSGGVAYARGHIRTIATLIGADSDALVAELESTSGEIDRPMIDLLAENFVTTPQREGPRISYKTLITVAATILGLLILVPAVSSLFNSGQSSKALISSQSKSNSIPKSTPSTTPSPSDSSSNGAVLATKTSDVRVVINAISGSTWLGITDSSGLQIFSGKLDQGVSRTYSGRELLRFVIGNAGAVNLNVNGKDLGTPGAIGEVVHLEFGPGVSSQG